MAGEHSSSGGSLCSSAKDSLADTRWDGPQLQEGVGKAEGCPPTKCMNVVHQASGL